MIDKKKNIKLGEGSLQNNGSHLEQGMEDNNYPQNNIAVGDKSLHNNIRGNQNSASGGLSLSENIDHHNNSAFGFKSLKNVNGKYNSAFGAKAGTELRNGYSNTLIGKEANTLKTDSVNETVVGANSVGGGNNTVTLGNSKVTEVNMSQSKNAELNSGQLSIYDEEGNKLYALPEKDGKLDQLLQTDGQGNLSWENDKKGSGGSSISNNPPTANDRSGNIGDLRYDNDYLYLCIGNNIWKQITLESARTGTPVMNDININTLPNQNIYNINLKEYTTDIYNNLDYVSYEFSDYIDVTSTNNTFVKPSDLGDWSQIGDGWWGWRTNHSIELGTNFINFGGSQYSTIYLGNGRITLSNIGYDYSESVTEFNANPMICPLWDIQGWSSKNSNSNSFGNIRYKVENNILKIYILTREYDGNNIYIKDANGDLIINNKEWSTDSRQEYMVTIQLNTTVQGNITFEYGRMTPGNDFPGINGGNYGSQDAIVGISYGSSNNYFPRNNINYEINDNNDIFKLNEPIMKQYLTQTSVGGTSNLSNRKIEFKYSNNLQNGYSINGSNLEINKNNISKTINFINAINNGSKSNIISINVSLINNISINLVEDININTYIINQKYFHYEYFNITDLQDNILLSSSNVPATYNTSKGILSIDSNNNLIYRSNLNENGTDTALKYYGYNSAGYITEQKNIIINITPVDDEPVMSDIVIDTIQNQNIYYVNLKDYTTDVDNNLDNVSYQFSDYIDVTSTNNTFVIPNDIDNWPEIANGWWGWSTNHSIELGTNIINFNGNQYNRIYLGNGRITLSNIDYDSTETVEEFNNDPMICPLWDKQGWSKYNSNYFGNIRYKVENNLLKIYILTREYDGSNIYIKDTNGNIIANNKAWTTDSRQEYMVTIQLNTTVQGNITFEYGRMTPGNDFPGINNDGYGSQDAIVGISYGLSNEYVPVNNIDYEINANDTFKLNEPIMKQYLNQTIVSGTSNLSNRKIEFKYTNNLQNGYTISDSNLEININNINKNKNFIYAINNGLKSNIVKIKFFGTSIIVQSGYKRIDNSSFGQENLPLFKLVNNLKYHNTFYVTNELNTNNYYISVLDTSGNHRYINTKTAKDAITINETTENIKQATPFELLTKSQLPNSLPYLSTAHNQGYFIKMRYYDLYFCIHNYGEVNIGPASYIGYTIRTNEWQSFIIDLP